MREENNRPAQGTDAAVADIIVEKNIKTSTTVHTGAQSETRHIPTNEGDEKRSLDVNVGSSRFIKTGTTPFHSVRAEQSEQETVTEISNFADRLTTKASASKIHTGYTGKLNTYDAVHAAGSRSEKMIRPKTAEEIENEDDAAEETPAAEPKAEEVAADNGSSTANEAAENEAVLPADDDPTQEASTVAANKTEETAEDVPAAETPADDKTKVIGGAKPPVRRKSRKRPLNTKSDLLIEIASSAEEDVRRNPDQLMMDGFSDPEKEAEENERRKREAEELEKELSKSRAKFVSNFKFRGHPEDKTPADEKFSGETGEQRTLPGPLQKIADKFAHLPGVFTPVNSREYSDYNERKAVFTALMEARRNTLARIGLVGLLGLVLLLINFIAHVSAGKHNGVFTVLGGNYNVLLIVNLVFLALTCAMLLPELKSGVISALKVHPCADTALLLIMGGALLQNVAAFFTTLQLENEFRLLTPAAILLSLPYLAAKLFYYDNTRHCFKSVAAKSDKTYLRKITDRQLTARMLCDSDTAETNVVYAGKTRFISRFLSRSAESAFDGMPAARTVCISAGIALVAAILAWILNKNFIFAATALPLVLAISFPVCSLVVSGWMIAEENKRLSLKSSFILRYADAHDFSAVDDIAVDADELFSGTVTDCLTATGVREKQARFVAAAVAKQAGGMTASTFADDILNFDDKIPPAETLVYEDRLGLSAWVNGCKVLLGTQALLKNHNVTIPAEEKINSILGQGELPLFLAMEGHFTAVFAVRYDARANFSAGLSELVERGTNLLITTTDANITERFAQRLLGISADCVRMIGAAAAQQFAEAKSARADTEDAGVVFGDSFVSLCRCAAAAIRLERTQKLSQLLCNFGAWAMLAIALIFVATGIFTRMPSIVPVVLQALWLAICFAAPILTNKLGGEKRIAPRSEKRPARARKTEGADDWDDGWEDFEPADDAPAAAESAANAAPAQASPVKSEPTQRREMQPDTVYEIEVKTGTPAEKQQNETRVADETGMPSEATFDYFEKQNRPRQKQPTADNEPPEDDFEEFDSSEAAQKKKPFAGFRLPAKRQTGEKKPGKAGGLFSKLMAPPDFDDEDDASWETQRNSPFRPKKRANRTAEQPFEDFGEEPQTPAEKVDTDDPFLGTYSLPPLPDQRFSLFSKGEERYNRNKSARQIEDDYEANREMEQAVRRTFTAPEPPEAPYYDLKKKEEPEPVISGRFVPPEEKVNFYDDQLFSRFEDDKIFAGLYDENGNRRRD